jgi:proteasome lid subunit RPN8/RPN11
MIVIPAPIHEAICEHADAGAPEEVVGVLAGSYDATESTVSRAYRARNAAARPTTRYEIDPEEELELLERIEEAGLECVGFYHSHPNGPSEPSETDARLAAWSGYSYVIASVRSGSTALESWRWNGDRFDSEAVRIE